MQCVEAPVRDHIAEVTDGNSSLYSLLMAKKILLDQNDRSLEGKSKPTTVADECWDNLCYYHYINLMAV